MMLPVLFKGFDFIKVVLETRTSYSNELEVSLKSVFEQESEKKKGQESQSFNWFLQLVDLFRSVLTKISFFGHCWHYMYIN